ncbi:hypothetical protein [Actinocatenispora sera]|uniref:hypothetical protein n=1 Tax=Actinocatenispora sera TaxID=390989 RepID=UPI0012EE2977|nr:hypothetical protein [Actinocatenispora sera]
MLLLLLNRVPARLRTILGGVFLLAGAVLTGVSKIFAAGLVIHGVSLAGVGAVLAVSGVVALRRAARESGPAGAPVDGTEQA